MTSNNSMTFREWLTLIGLTCAAFIFNTSEFIPIGLLSDIAQDFSMSEAQAGMLISIYAWLVMLLSLPLMLLVSRMELRKLLLFVLFLFTIFQVLSACSESYNWLLLSRVGVACAHSIFWSIVSPMAVRLVPDRFRSLALGMIVTGTSIATIFGLPLGRLIGLYLGWRMAFLSIGVLSTVIFAYLFFTLPTLPSRGSFSLQRLPELFCRKSLFVLFVLTFLISGSYYVGYSYIEPFLKQVAGLDDNWITLSLMIFGASGLLGSFAFSKYYALRPILFTKIVLLVLTFCLFFLQLSSVSLFSVLLLFILWGASVTAYNVSFQSEIIKHSPADATSVSMSVFSGIFNLGIGCGTWIGGVTCTCWSLSFIGYAGAFFAVLALVYWFRHKSLLYSH